MLPAHSQGKSGRTVAVAERTNLRGRGETEGVRGDVSKNCEEGNYFKGYCGAAEKPVFCNEINISGFDGSIENSGLVDAYHRDYSAPHSWPLMQIKILIRGLM